jgi:hypothetical protein
MTRIWELNCLNCEAPLEQNQAYCARCGQKIGAPRLTMHEIGHEFMHALTNVDRSALRLLCALIVRPGLVARDYVLGRRKRYFGPFGFFTVAVAVSSAAIALGHLSMVPGSDPRLVAVSDSMRAHANLLTLVQAPLLAAVCRLFFIHVGNNFAEYLVLAAYTSGMRALFFSLVVLPSLFLLRATGHELWVLSGYFAVWAGYFGFAASQFHAQRHGWTWLTGVVAVITAEIAASIILSLAISAYLGSISVYVG